MGSLEEAREIRTAFAAGADFAQLARERSTDDTAAADGLVPFLVRQERSPLARVAFSTLTDTDLLRTVDYDAPPGERRYYVSDVPEKFGAVASKFLGEPIDKITRVDISGY